MPLDTNLILGAKPAQFDFSTLSQLSPMNALTNVMKFKQFEQEGELNALKIKEYERARTQEEGLRNYLRGGREMPAPDLSSPDTRSALTTQFGTPGLTYAKALSEQDTAALTQKKTAFEVQKAKQAFISQVQRDISNNPSDANITAYKEDLLANPLFDAAEKAQLVTGADRFLAMPVNERQMFLSSQGASASDLRPQAVAPGSSLVQGGKTVYTAPERQDTDLIRNFNAAKAQGFTGNIFDYERKIKEASRQPAQPVAPTITEIVDPKNPNQMLKIDARRYTGGSVNSPGVLGVGGKEPSAAVRENKAEVGKTQLADDLDNLRASFTRLDEMRAIPSTARNPLSNIASATAATGIGQTAGRFVGTEAQVEREVINSARTRLVNSIKNATGMSAQQLNSNVELQTMLKSISDPGQPIEAALRIIDDIDNAYVKGAGMTKKPAGGKPAANVVTNPQFPGFSVGKP